MNAMLSNPMFGLLLSFACYAAGVFIRRIVKTPLAYPLLIADIILIIILEAAPLTVEQYMSGGMFINMFIVPVTVILAQRIYHERRTLLANVVPIIAGCAAGSAAAVFSTLLLCRLFGVGDMITVSAMPRSVTTAVALELSKNSGGLPGVTMCAVLFSGMFCASVMPFFVKRCKLKDPVAVGIAMGTTGHAIGTSAALELGETSGAMSGIAIGIAGIITSVIFVIINMF